MSRLLLIDFYFELRNGNHVIWCSAIFKRDDEIGVRSNIKETKKRKTRKTRKKKKKKGPPRQ